MAVETSKPVLNVYSLISSPDSPTTNILVPSGLNSNSSGWPSSETLAQSTKVAVETSKPVSNVYSQTLSFSLPKTNILVPFWLNCACLASSSSELTSKLSTKVAVERSKPVDNVYSLTSSPWWPTINILVPSLLNDNPFGVVSSEFTLKLSTNVGAAETSEYNKTRATIPKIFFIISKRYYKSWLTKNTYVLDSHMTQ